MLADLDDTLRQLLTGAWKGDRKGDIGAPNISFDIPTREWSAACGRAIPQSTCISTTFARIYDLRQMSGDDIARTNGEVKLKPRAVWMDLSYIVTCWTDPEDHHKLHWWVLKTLYCNSPLPVDKLQGDLNNATRPIRTQVAQPDGGLKNSSEFWTALNNNIRPAINLLVTLELDISQDIRASQFRWTRLSSIRSWGTRRSLHRWSAH